MKKIVLGISLLSLLVSVSCKENAAQKIEESKLTAAAARDAASTKMAKIEILEKDYDFGDIKQGTEVEHVFTYKNVGEGPLVVTDIKSSCGCTVPKDWSRAPLAPGQEGKFTLKYNGSGDGKVTKTVTITANTESGNEVVTINANVKK